MTRAEQDELADRIRAAIRDSGLSNYEIGQRSGVDKGSLSRFMGGGSLKLATASKIAAAIGLEVVLKKKR